MDYQEIKPLVFHNPPNQNYNELTTSLYNPKRPRITYAKKVDYSVM